MLYFVTSEGRFPHNWTRRASAFDERAGGNFSNWKNARFYLECALEVIRRGGGRAAPGDSRKMVRDWFARSPLPLTIIAATMPAVVERPPDPLPTDVGMLHFSPVNLPSCSCTLVCKCTLSFRTTNCVGMFTIGGVGFPFVPGRPPLSRCPARDSFLFLMGNPGCGEARAALAETPSRQRPPPAGASRGSRGD